MALRASDIFIGLPDQPTTGAIFSAAAGTATPTTIPTTGSVTGFVGSGYVTDDGVEVSPNWSTSKLTEWSGNAVRTLLESFEGTITFSLMGLLDEDSVKQAFGATNVTVTAATSAHGKQMAISLGTTLPDEQAWVFLMKDGDSRAMICVPRGQVSAIDTIAFNRNNAAAIPVTLDCLADSNGKSIYIYTDDGLATS